MRRSRLAVPAFVLFPFFSLAAATEAQVRSPTWPSRQAQFETDQRIKRMVHHPGGRIDQFRPGNRLLALIYYQTGEGFRRRRRTHLWNQASYDDGMTWTAPLVDSGPP